MIEPDLLLLVVDAVTEFTRVPIDMIQSGIDGAIDAVKEAFDRI